MQGTVHRLLCTELLNGVILLYVLKFDVTNRRSPHTQALRCNQVWVVKLSLLLTFNGLDGLKNEVTNENKLVVNKEGIRREVDLPLV